MAREASLDDTVWAPLDLTPVGLVSLPSRGEVFMSDIAHKGHKMKDRSSFRSA